MGPTDSRSRRLPATGPACPGRRARRAAARQRRGTLRHRLADADQRLGDPGGAACRGAPADGLVGGDRPSGSRGDRIGRQVLHRQPGQQAADHLGDGDHHRRHRVLGVHRGTGQHHGGVVVGVVDAVGEDDAAAHAVAEHDALQCGMRGGGDADEVIEVAGVLRDVPQVDPLAAGPAVATVVEGIREEPPRRSCATWS